MTDLILSGEFKQAVEASAQTPEGNAALDGFVKLIVEWAIDQMTPEQREVFATPEGFAELKKMWPDIVKGYFRYLCPPPPPRKPRKKVRTPTAEEEIASENARLVAEHEAAVNRYRSAFGTPEAVAAANGMAETVDRLREFARKHSTE